jgi:ribosomal protein S18 acetylase RimI-like enzyme
MTEFIVRRATPADGTAIRVLGSRLREGAAPWRPQEKVAEVAQRWLDESIDAMDDDHPMWVAIDSRSVVGVGSASIRDHFTGQTDCYLGELVIKAEHEGVGIGRALVAAVEAWAGTRGLRRVTLETGAANVRARRFYASLDYLEEEVQLTRVLPSQS